MFHAYETILPCSEVTFTSHWPVPVYIGIWWSVRNFLVCFGQKIMTEHKKILIDNYYKTITGLARTECSPCRVFILSSV